MRRGDRFEMTADELDDAGHGVGVADDVRVHVADLLPSEMAEIEIDHVSPHRPEAWGHIETRTGPTSADRVRPACPAFGACGGCAWQALAYPAQLARKRARVRAALAGLAELESIVPSPTELGYRNKGKYVIAAAPNDRTILGAYQPRTHRVVDTAGCRVVEPVIDRLARLIAERFTASGLPPHDEQHGTGVLRHAVIRTSAAGQALICVITTSAARPSELLPIAEALATDPDVAGVSWAVNDRPGGAIFDTRAAPPTTLAGVATVPEPLFGAEVALDATSFFQINRAQAHRMYAALAELTGAGEHTRAIDLYCGVGGIAFALAAAGATVIGIELHAPAVAAANDAARAAGLETRVQFRTGRAADLAALAANADLLVVNPPRKGLDAETRAAIVALAPPMLAYVSCNPESLARDLGVLSEAGYAVARARAYDLMPGTAQVETLVICRRVAEAPPAATSTA